MENKTYKTKYQAIEELPYKFVEGIYNLNPLRKTNFDGSKRPTLLDKTSEFPLEVIDARKEKD
jgi:hypothetical protein